MPKPLLRLETEVRKSLAALRRQALHAAESPLEFGVGGTQRRLGVDIEFAGQVRRRKQQIAHFLEDLPRRSARGWLRCLLEGGDAHFREFLGDLVRCLAGLFPIKPHASSPLAELDRPHQRGERARHAVQMA